MHMGKERIVERKKEANVPNAVQYVLLEQKVMTNVQG